MVHVPPQTPIEDLVMILFSLDENEGPAPELSHLLERSPTLWWLIETCPNPRHNNDNSNRGTL
jgi:hypothetical protein